MSPKGQAKALSAVMAMKVLGLAGQLKMATYVWQTCALIPASVVRLRPKESDEEPEKSDEEPGGYTDHGTRYDPEKKPMRGSSPTMCTLSSQPMLLLPACGRWRCPEPPGDLSHAASHVDMFVLKSFLTDMCGI